jgi:hypothetical protein
VTHAAASYDPWIRRPTLIMLPALAALTLAACGAQTSTLPPSPGASGTVALPNLARHPEVYAGAQVSTVGTVERTIDRRTPLFVLTGGHGTRIVLEPSSSAASELGKRARVSGFFTVTFQLGYEILISRIAPAGTL